VTGNIDAPAKRAARRAPGSAATGRRRLLAIGIWGGCGLAALALWAAYIRLSQTFPTDSDGAGNAYQAWQMLHGNPLLRGWELSDVSFYTTELPQYALVELVTGLNANVIHVAAGMTYALALIGAVALAAGRARGWAAVIGGCIAAGIMLDPQGADGVLVLLSSPDHIGTSVPIMLAWVILDRTRPSWAAAAAVSVVLAVAGVADSLVTYAAIAPLVLVVAIRLVQALRRDRAAGWRSTLAERRYEIGLAVGAIASVIVARLALRLIAALGGFGSPAPISSVGSVSHILDHNVPVVAHGLLLLFGADFLDYPVGVVLVLHLVSVLLVVVGIAVTCWHFLTDLDLVAQLLLAGIVINVAIFVVSTNVSGLPTMREIAPVLPFSAALAGRQLGPWLGDALAARRRRPGQGPGRGPGRGSWLPRSVATGLLAALGLVGVGYTVGLARQLTRHIPVSSEQRLAWWLEGHHLDNGVGGYWQSTSVSLVSDDKVQIRLVDIGYRLHPQKLVKGVREDYAGWYDTTDNTADFVVLAPGDGEFSAFTDRAAVIATFGQPPRTYHFEQYTILVWPYENLLTELVPYPS
jgi:hypothetical protein